jgi:hypothetical protein
MRIQGKAFKNATIFVVLIMFAGWIASSRVSWASIDAGDAIACDTMARLPDYRKHDHDHDADFTIAVASGDWRQVRSYLLWGYATPENLTAAQKARIERERISADLIPYSARGDRTTVLRYLRLGADANVDADADDFVFPLAWAARCDHPEVVKILLAHGARVDARFTYPGSRGWIVGSTALEWAVQSGARRSVAALLAHHANPRLVSSFEPLPGFESLAVTPKKDETVLDAATDSEIRKMIAKVLKAQRGRPAKRH